jgi:COPII coat assembly protein SEC16
MRLGSRSYLLSPQVSPWDVINELNPPKVTLYGSPDGTVNPEALIYSELVEYALSQAPVPKGKDAFSGIPHLLPYKLRKAWQLLEFGNASLARS